MDARVLNELTPGSATYGFALTPRWHPTRELLTDYATGILALGPSLGIGIHLDACPTCRATVGGLEEAEGQLLASQDGAPLRPGALEDALARLDGPAAGPPRGADIFRASAIALPASLERIGFQPPIHLGPETWVAHLDARRQDAWRTYVFCGSAGTELPLHGHLGEELIVVLEGGFHDPREFGVGDFAQNSPGSVHGMQVSAEGRLVALIASAGPIEWRVNDRGLGELLDI